MTINIHEVQKKSTVTKMSKLLSTKPFIATFKGQKVFGMLNSFGNCLIILYSNGQCDSFTNIDDCHSDPSFEDVQYVEVKNIDVTLLN